MNGTPSQIEWAERIKQQVNAEFDRVADAFRGSAERQSEQERLDTHAIIAILEQKRLEVMARDEAGYFIRNWQELSDQVRQLIGGDPAYQSIRAKRQVPSRPVPPDAFAGESARNE